MCGATSLQADLMQLMPKKRFVMLVSIAIGLVIMGTAVGSGFLGRNAQHPQGPTEVFSGITYGCDRLERTEEGDGLVHWVRIELARPGVELYVTPLNPAAVAVGWQYRLRRTEEVVKSEHLALAINATLFTA